MNKTMGKRKAIFLGNGFTRALVNVALQKN